MFIDPSGMVIQIQAAPKREDYGKGSSGDNAYSAAKATYEAAMVDLYRAFVYLLGSQTFYDLYAKLENAKEVFTELGKTLPEKTVIFNVASMLPDAEYFALAVEAMFYGNRICYQGNPLNEEIIENLHNQGYTIAIFTHIEIPEYIKENSRIIKIYKTL
jgi:hypothetical protein